MNFTEIVFLPFLLIVLGLERLIDEPRLQIGMLLVASLVFYGWWKVELLPLLLFSSVVDFVSGARIARSEDTKTRRRWLIVSMISNLGLLGFFKYANFGIRSLSDLMLALGVRATHLHTLDIILPVGISFYTFQTMSYTIDVYRRQIEPEKSFVRFMCFVTLFPQLVAGPIVRAADLLPQMREMKSRKYDYTGLFLILFGFAKKLLIADPLGALLVDPAFADPSSKSSGFLLLAAYGYSFQIFCDFSAYSDIAIGVGRLLGFEFPKNFDAPYLAGSLGQFWRRWHISLSTWFRDYVYLPLGGNRGTRRQWLIAAMSVFLLSGLWHGANYTFIVWGSIHGVIFVSERMLGSSRLGALAALAARHPPPGYRVLRTLFTFHVVTLAWVFFRAQSLPAAVEYLTTLASHVRQPLETLAPGVLPALVVAAVVHVVVEPRVERSASAFLRLPALVQAGFAIALGAAVYAGAEDALAHRAFIYFQF